MWIPKLKLEILSLQATYLFFMFRDMKASENLFQILVSE